MQIEAALVLAWMVSLEPSSPLRSSFERTAEAIARESNRSPLPGLDELRTAAVVTSLAWFESRFRVDAEGDCLGAPDRSGAGQATGTCPKGSRPRSLGLLQIGVSNLAGLRISRDEALDVDGNVRAGLAMARRSFRVCASRPLHERLAWYAAGGPACSTDPDAVAKSQHRIDRAVRLYAAVAR